jgi:hypothetical protein
MALVNSDIVLNRSALISDTVPAQNGGRMIHTQVVDGVKNNAFPDVSSAQRLSGATRWRKLFWFINSNTVTPMHNARVFIDRMTGADDYLLLQSATATGTEATDKDEALLYGAGALDSNVNAGVESIAVTCEHADYATLLPFRAGMLVRISNIPVGDGAGTEEFVLLTAVSFNGAAATLTFTGHPLANAYSASDTLVSGVLEVSTVAGGFNSAAYFTSTGGTFAFNTPGNLTVPSKGSVNDAWTLTFSNATTFTVSGAVTGVLAGTGTVGADYSAINPSTSTPFFTILAAAWGGAFAAGDTVTFNTTQACLPLLVRQRIPAGSGTLANNVGGIAIRGESA